MQTASREFRGFVLSGRFSSGFQAYLETQPPERQRSIIQGEAAYTEQRRTLPEDPSTRAYVESFYGFMEGPAAEA